MVLKNLLCGIKLGIRFKINDRIMRKYIEIFTSLFIGIVSSLFIFFFVIKDENFHDNLNIFKFEIFFDLDSISFFNEAQGSFGNNPEYYVIVDLITTFQYVSI